MPPDALVESLFVLWRAQPAVRCRAALEAPAESTRLSFRYEGRRRRGGGGRRRRIKGFICYQGGEGFIDTTYACMTANVEKARRSERAEAKPSDALTHKGGVIDGCQGRIKPAREARDRW